MLTPSYIPQAASVSPDVYGALYDFVLAYGLAAGGPLPEDNIYRGWENRSALPAGSNEYAVITVAGTTRRGTGTETINNIGSPDNEPEQYQIRTWYEVLAQVDFCSDTDVARQRVYSLDSIFRSTVGVNFFSAYGITAQYADNIQELTFVDEADQYVKRYALTLHLGYWAGVDVESSWFDTVDLNRVEDVDAHHPPTE